MTSLWRYIRFIRGGVKQNSFAFVCLLDCQWFEESFFFPCSWWPFLVPPKHLLKINLELLGKPFSLLEAFSKISLRLDQERRSPSQRMPYRRLYEPALLDQEQRQLDLLAMFDSVAALAARRTESAEESERINNFFKNKKGARNLFLELRWSSNCSSHTLKARAVQVTAILPVSSNGREDLLDIWATGASTFCTLSHWVESSSLKGYFLLKVLDKSSSVSGLAHSIDYNVFTLLWTGKTLWRWKPKTYSPW